VPSETDYKRAFRASYKGWISAVEPGRGSDTGAADLLVLVGDVIVPVELKIAEPEEGMLWVKKPGIRPAQIAWHSTLWRSGGFSLFAFGIWRDKAWHTAFVHGHEVANWRDGFDYFSDFRADELKNELERLTGRFFD